MLISALTINQLNFCNILINIYHCYHTNDVFVITFVKLDMIFNKTKYLLDFFQQYSILFQKTLIKPINHCFKI